MLHVSLEANVYVRTSAVGDPLLRHLA